MKFSRGTWVLQRNTPDFSPLDFEQRFVGRFSRDGKTIKGTWQTRAGATWERDFHLTYTRRRRRT